VNIVVTDKNKMDESRLMNYLTSPNVVVWSAAVASCAIPSIYDPVELFEKDPISGEIVPYHRIKTLYVDGSVAQDLPMQRLSELFNINSFIVSQVNPHVLPFLNVESSGMLESSFKKKFMRAFKGFVRNEIRHIIIQTNDLGILPLNAKRATNWLLQN